MHTVGAHIALDVTVQGELSDTGYLLDIKVIDRAVRDAVLPLLQAAYRESFAGEPASSPTFVPTPVPALTPSPIIDRCATALDASLRSVANNALLASLRWHLSPMLSLEFVMANPQSVSMRQRFDFAAAHRLNMPNLSEEQNRALFGKCNNPRGHGHNYQFEPCVQVPVGGLALPLHEFEAIVSRVLLDRFDHKHLNEDTVEFDVDRGGLNPSVENIAKTFYDLLAPELVSRYPAVQLASITVWETDRTSATYPGA